ncbi:MAG: DUF58 domain-containing protein [Leptospiraceae bacterium]|nr:DUF58 domain-containing protein [Leptospiraceae bacterium]
MELQDLIKKVHELELIGSKNAYSILTGDYVTKFPGRGLLFHEARKYVPGESIRLIDWNMTARLGEPYVKVLLEEREREIIVALDMSPSMFSGWQDKTKIEYAIELAATLSVSGIKSRDKVGLVLFNNNVLKSLRPISGRIQLFRCLKSMLLGMEDYRDWEGETDIRSVFHEIQKNRNKRYIVFIISDFIDRDIPDDLKFVRAGHDVSFLHVYDPLEYEMANEILIPSYSPEKEEDKRNTGILHPGEVGSLEEIQNYLKNESIKYKVTFDSFATNEPISKKLKDFFHKKKKRVL